MQVVSNWFRGHCIMHYYNILVWYSSSANKCLLKVAQYAAQLEQYAKAIQIYEQVAASSMDNQLLRYSAKDHFFRAALCHMCQDTQDATIALQKYEEMFPAFTDARECKLVKVSQ